MTIKYAILGILSWKPSTGYELKKIFEESSAMYWSGNNNQIYKTLVQLLDDGLVTNKVQHQEGSPTKKIYSITSQGTKELKEWVLSIPEPPEFKKTFLIQLAWADQLNSKELYELFSNYEKEVRIQLLLQEEKKRRKIVLPERTPREVLLWELISENLISFYINELEWIYSAREQLFDQELIKEGEKMDYKIIDNGTKKYIELISAETPLNSEQDAIDIISLGWEKDINMLMIHGEALSEDFFKLRTGIAGKILQKFINYNIKVAALIPQELVNTGRFREMVLEANKGNSFRVFESRENAEAWLIK